MLKVPTDQNNTQAFEGLAKDYDQFRPAYPRPLHECIIHYWQEVAGERLSKPVIVDVGCGTGISTKTFYAILDGNCQMIGVEPGNDMLATARESSPAAIVYEKGFAEAIPMVGKSVDILTAAQAAQWFERDRFYAEACRVLKASGVIAIYENNRNWRGSKFLNKYEQFLEAYSVNPGAQKSYSRYYRDFPYIRELAGKFRDVQEREFHWIKSMLPADFLAMAATSTQVQRAENCIGKERVAAMILENANNHVGKDGQVDVPYITKLYMARK